MCGIVAVISKKPYGLCNKDIDIFEELLYVDALRGWDSTGVITVDKDGGFYIDKEAVSSFEFLLDYPKCESRKKALATGVALIGHNRKGTVGKVSDETAHPFVVKKNFAMVHNGTLYNHKNLADTTVDSEALTMVIQEALDEEYSGDPELREKFYKEQLETTLGKVFGAYAVVWFDQQTNKIQFIRNDQRPLWVCETDDAWLISSEGGMVQWILSRNQIKLTSLKLCEHDTLYTLPLDMNKVVLKEEKLELKKALHTTQAANSGVGKTITTANVSGINSITKAEFKRLKKKYLETKIEFFVSNYVEKHLFAGMRWSSDYTILGEAPDLDKIPHMIEGTINIKQLGIKNAEDIDAEFYRGLITEMEYDMKQKQVYIKVDNIKMVTSSIPANDETSTTLH